MNLLDEVVNRFADDFDRELMADPDYRKISGILNSFCEENLTPEQADRLNEIAGQFSSAVFRTAVKTGVRFGAKLLLVLLSEGDDKNVQ